jgi:hypothetical protein
LRFSSARAVIGDTVTTETPLHLSDDDIETVPMTATDPIKASDNLADADGADADGSDGSDGSDGDGSDADGSDGDATDTTDGDATDGDATDGDATET